MKSVIKIINMDSQNDARKIEQAVIKNDGIIASQTSLKTKEVTVIFNESFLKIENIIDSIEDLGYIVI